MIEFCYQEKINNYFVPNGTPPFIVDKMKKMKTPLKVFDNGGFQEELQLEIGVSTFKHIIELLQYSNIEYKECLINERINKKYFFPIPLFGSAEGILGISEGQVNYEFTRTFSNQVISDIKENNCKVLLDGLDEGLPFKKEWCEKLHQLLDDLKLPRKSFYFLTSNVIFKDWYDKYFNKNEQINILTFTWAETFFQEICIESKLDNEKFLSHNRHKHFISLNRSPRKHRKNLFEYLKSKNLLKYGYVSYAAENYFVDREYSLGASDNPNTNFIDRNFFEDSYFNIVTETWFYEKSLLFTEKIFKSMIYFQPFLVFGSAYFLKYLKKMGYKTFDSIIDESYDEEEDNDKRFNMVTDEINCLCKMSIDEVHDIYLRVQDVLKYNYNHFLSEHKVMGIEFFK